ncbi:restriction endonuclease subunit S [Campylobacter upsaliensis]|uniref:restriction endonuclease subunit S n=1 Tax=Campylobacter upsaliensis TaxID=28080 RepID=UPI002B3641B6|nr:restriction endonuclease subunit S [Campylobacter upsaliensis]MEB2804330.1 restriction endonuclease subunit S [Campylobacter upsaliensis]MEB2812453.1 restriction endonuclease subunit S [Campylobacter upsaliensis]MEB2823505.1 restriction endonuclease subunit S [Campylobacter upsaliensis]
MKKHTQSPYESSKVSYKPSGIEWLGEIPQSWEIRRLKYLFYISKEESRDEFPNVLSLTQNGIIERDITTNKGQLAQNYIGYNIVKRGDIILNPMDLSSGYVAKSTFEGVISQAYIKIRPLETLNLSYYESFFQNLYHYKILWHLGKGISYDHRWTLGNDVFLNIKIPLPPLQEQKEIAEFLDSKCEKIQNYIDKKQKLITLLQEKKQALINEAVCGRVACHTERSEVSTTAYKPSGIEYLGLIPHHWEVRRMKFMASIHNGREQTEIADENGIYPIYGSGGILGKSMYFIYDKPSVLLGRKGTIDKPLFVEEPFWTIDTMFYTSVSKIVLPKYFYYLCLTIDFQFYISGSAIPSMTQYDLANISFALPPLQEQKQIANFLDEKCEKINSVIEKTKKQIELVKEYKNTLINEAVCGRINLQKRRGYDY